MLGVVQCGVDASRRTVLNPEDPGSNVLTYTKCPSLSAPGSALSSPGGAGHGSSGKSRTA